MFSHVVLFCLVLICKRPSGADETKPSLADQLNATLSFPGWQWITNVGAKYRIAGNESFTGKDLYVPNSLPFDNSLNTFVRDDNAAEIHYMVTHLVGCVYVNEMVKFMELLSIIFEDVTRVFKNQKANSYRRKKRKLDDANKAAEEAVPDQIKTIDNPRDRQTDEKFVDFKESWEIFNFALLQLTESSTMFDVMFSTMRYLIDTIPSDESFDPHVRELLDIYVVPCLKYFKDVSRNINLVLPEYIGKTDPDYNDKVCQFSQTFIKFLNSEANTNMLPFLESVCTVSEVGSPKLMTEISIFKDRYCRKPTSLDIAHQLGEDISKLVHKLYNNYYSQLGFLYDFREQTTSYAIPTTQ